MSTPRRRVLFICIGNACRSQMAEAFARTYGKDVIEPSSSGLAPGFEIPAVTREVMHEKGIEMTGQFPKPAHPDQLQAADLVINLSGAPLAPSPKLREWVVQDPMGYNDDMHRRVRDQVEGLVLGLVMELRRETPAPTKRTRPKLLRG